jgi:hypothetical protein
MAESKKIARWVPTGYELLRQDEETGLEVWGVLSPKIYAIAYVGRRAKHEWHYQFSSVESLNARMDALQASVTARAAYKAEKRAEGRAPHDVKVGDVFRASWGYDQTNIDYYECTRVMGAMIEVREIGAQSEHTGDMQGKCVPAPGAFVGEPMRKRVSVFPGSEPSVRITSFCSARRIKPVAEFAGVRVYDSSEWTAYA